MNRDPKPTRVPAHRQVLLTLGLALLLTACPDPPVTPPPPPPPPPPVIPPPPPPPPPAELQSTALGSVNLPWLTTSRDPITDSSGRVKFTPLVFSDLDYLSTATRYLTMTYSVENLGTTPLENLSLRAYNRSGNLGGTAIFDLRCVSGATNCPPDELITSETVAQQIKPIQGTVLRSEPSPDADSSDFQAYRASESAALTTSARASSLLGASETVLDYGFTARDAPRTGRKLAPGDQGYITIAVRLPRRFTSLGIATPYSFRLSFLVSTDDTTRVSRALGESTDAARDRAVALGSASKPAELVLLGTDTDAPVADTIRVLRLDNVRIGTAPTPLIAP